MPLFQNINLICILGPTASGKTAFAANLAARLGGEIISADSRQVYRNMDIGTGKDLGDYMINGIQIPFHLVDIVNAGSEYNVFQFQKDFLAAFNNIRERGKLPILCGGTGMYIEAVLKAYKLINVPVNEILRKELEPASLEELESRLKLFKQLHNTTDITIRERLIRAIEIEEYYLDHPDEDESFIGLSPVIFGIMVDRESRRKRITERLKYRLQHGMIEEVQNLLDSGITPEKLIFYGLEYKYLTWYLTGKLSYDEMVLQLNTAIHQFAKRQMTWFRKMERDGFKIHWIDGSLDLEEKLRIADLGLRNADL
jgi:tRNA dimethylallyltransferase